MPTAPNPFGARKSFTTPSGTAYTYYDLGELERAGLGSVRVLPYSVRVLLESLLRNVDGVAVTEEDVRRCAAWQPNGERGELAFQPARVVLQDFTGVPAVVDLAAMRTAMQRMGGDPSLVNPLIPCDLVIDHSVQVDAYASATALTVNGEMEFGRNAERYEFLKWGQQAFDNFSVVPPATGIVHQVNLEHLAKCVWTKQDSATGATVAFPDSLVGTDSHTTMINGLGVVGWGVGGIEAEACMLGQPIYILTPDVVGMRLTGALPEGATATDLVLTITQTLRSHGVVGKFVEFCGSGLAALTVPDRGTIANMAPEYGATIGFFPVDAKTLDYLRLTGRDEETVALVESYCRANGMFWTPDAPEPSYTDLLELDMSTVQPSLAGPKRPQDRVQLSDMQPEWRNALPSLGRKGADKAAKGVELNGETFDLADGSVVIAAITSCTNTSNPDVMLAAGLLAKKANALGLKAKPWVKTSLAPGSKVVTEYYDKAQLTPELEAFGFHTVGYGCTTCIGNSGPLPDSIAGAIESEGLVATSVLSGNRNFEGRISPHVRANYLASPPLVVAYAIAGTVDIDLASDPLGSDASGNAVYLKDIWPTHAEVVQTRESCIDRSQFERLYGGVFDGNPDWNAVPSASGADYSWSGSSTYIHHPPFFQGMTESPPGITPISGARCLVSLDDSVTTDHISPAGSIAKGSPAAEYLRGKGVAQSDFNSYGSRRGNDEVMVRGTFANVRVQNRLAPGTEGGWTTDFTDGSVKPIYEAACSYKTAGTPLVVLAGIDYGMGSSRDWAAKGTSLLGVRAVIAKSYERIHRSNLVGMGVLPLQFAACQGRDELGLDGSESFDFEIPASFEPRCAVGVTATHPESGKKTAFVATSRVDTPVEAAYYKHGGILQMVLRRMLDASVVPA